MTTYETVKWEISDGIGTITLNRPDALNALLVESLKELLEVVEQATYDPDVRAVVITGAGRGFCAGADVKQWADDEYLQDGFDGKRKVIEEPWPPKAHTLMSKLYWMPKPVVAAVNGVAVGGGCDLTLVADMRIASTKARFGEVYMRLGFNPDAGGTFLLPRIVGEARAAELIYTGRIIDAEEALEIGLVSEVVEPDALLGRAYEIAGTFAKGPTTAIGIAKSLIRTNYTVSIEEALRNELRGGELCALTEDHREGMAAVAEKREPNFVGR